MNCPRTPAPTTLIVKGKQETVLPPVIWKGEYVNAYNKAPPGCLFVFHEFCGKIKTMQWWLKEVITLSKLDEKVLQAVKEAAPEGRLTCAKAHEIAKNLNVPLLTVGQAADELKIKIKNCQLGCF